MKYTVEFDNNPLVGVRFKLAQETALVSVLFV